MDQHTSSEFSYETIQMIRKQVVVLFKLAKTSDYLKNRWLVSAKDLGINCKSILRYVLKNSVKRKNIKFIENFNFCKRCNAKDSKKELDIY